MSSAIQIQFAEATHTGLVRSENQDRSVAFAAPIGHAYAVADGMGGRRGGAFAAQMAIQLLQGCLAQADALSPPEAALRAAIQTVNQKLHVWSQAGDPATAGMGCTLVCALVKGAVAHIVHVGDSRAYLWTGGVLKRLTRDHTVVEALVEGGILTEAQARDHHQAGILTRALGPQPVLEPVVGDPLTLQSGDILLLGSDGLSGYVPDEAIAAVLAANPDPKDAAPTLIGLALDAGGHDNVTVQVIAARGNEPGRRSRWMDFGGWWR